jgi:hypothetical protein
MTDQNINFIGDMQRLRVEPGDLFVISTDLRLTNDQREAFYQQAKRVLGCKKILFMECGMKLGVINADCADEAAGD